MKYILQQQAHFFVLPEIHQLSWSLKNPWAVNAALTLELNQYTGVETGIPSVSS